MNRQHRALNKIQLACVLRLAFALALIVAASLVLYPVAQRKNPILIWILLGFIGLAATITLLKER